MKYDKQIIKRAVEIRRSGGSYSMICDNLGAKIPKSTLSSWLSQLEESRAIVEMNKLNNSMILEKARSTSREYFRKARENRDEVIRSQNIHLLEKLNEIPVSKIALAFLYLGEGRKNRKAAKVSLGNSDPAVIKIFIRFLNIVYSVKPADLKCTVQCRADQDGIALNSFWSEITTVPLDNFSKPRYDPRTLGKPTKITSYKGVCVVECFKAKIMHDLLTTIDLIAGR